MAGPTRDSAQGATVDSMINEILAALEVIKKQLPNGELKAIQERIETLHGNQEEMKDDLRAIKRQLLDPEDGVIVRVNKNTEFRLEHEKDHEKEDDTFKKEYEQMMIEHREMMAFKRTASKVLWILFTAIAGIIAAMLFGQFGPQTPPTK